MILCHDLKEVLPRAGLLKNVFKCMSNYFNRNFIGKHWAAEELREEQKSSVWCVSETGCPRACCAHWMDFEMTTESTAMFQHLQRSCAGWKSYIENMLHKERQSVFMCLPQWLLSKNYCEENGICSCTFELDEQVQHNSNQTYKPPYTIKCSW